MADREFKGVWIPREIWLDERLNALDKIILTEIDSLDNGDEHCHAGNDYLAQFCQCSTSKVTKTVAKLIDLGYVKVHSFDGRIRKLRSCLAYCTPQNSKNSEAAKQNVRINNISNNKEINSISRKGADKENPTGFDDFWELYPRKVAKASAMKSWIRTGAPDSQALIDTILADIRRRVEGEWKGKEIQYIPHPSTYLNQKRWEDEPSATPQDDEYVPEYERMSIEEIMRRSMGD